MLDFVCAPMPFIIGVLQSQLEKIYQMPLEDVIIVHLDKGYISGYDQTLWNLIPTVMVFYFNLLFFD